MKPKILTTLPNYTRALFKADLVAGVTVAMVALPLSLAIAIASGADPAAGLTTAVVAGFLISALGGSRVQIGGPTGAFIVVVFGVIAEHGYGGLVTATLMAGCILMIAGYFKAGSLVRHVPEAVIDGFTIGIAILIATSQIKDLFGLTAENLPADFIAKLSALWDAADMVSGAALAVGLATLALIILLKRAAPYFPGAIVALALSSVVVAMWNLPVDTLHARFGPLPHSPPLPSLPDLHLARIIELLPSALVIAFLAGVESLLSASVADRMFGGQYRPNAEILAQGMANIGSALFGGMPATGAIARTATNVHAGGRTPVAGIVHALTILTVMLVAAPLAGYFAMPAMAALLILTAWRMSEPHKWRHHLRARRSDKTLMLLTMVLTVVVDLTVAIGAGVALGLALRLRRREVPDAPWSPPER